MTSRTDPLLEQTLLQCLWAHCHLEWGDRVPLDVFNRLLAKNIKPEGWTRCSRLNIQLSQIRSRRERRTTAELACLKRGHSDTSGEDFPCPIIVAVYEGKELLLDGNHRINRWCEQGNTDLHDVNVHAVEGTGRLVTVQPLPMPGVRSVT